MIYKYKKAYTIFLCSEINKLWTWCKFIWPLLRTRFSVALQCFPKTSLPNAHFNERLSMKIELWPKIEYLLNIPLCTRCQTQCSCLFTCSDRCAELVFQLNQIFDLNLVSEMCRFCFRSFVGSISTPFSMNVGDACSNANAHMQLINLVRITWFLHSI